MIVHGTGVRPSPLETPAIIKVPCSTNVEKLCASLGTTGYLRSHLEKYIAVATPVTSLLPNNTFALKLARKFYIE